MCTLLLCTSCVLLHLFEQGKVIGKHGYGTEGDQKDALLRKANLKKSILYLRKQSCAHGINIAVGNEITMPNCKNFSWTIDNIAAKDIRSALIKVNLISHDLGYLQEKFGFYVPKSFQQKNKNY